MSPLQSASKLNILVSQHVTQWFRRAGLDDLSPAASIQHILTLLLDYMGHCKLTLAVNETQFRRNICEFICTFYVANKRRKPLGGPYSRLRRPVGWTARHEREWQDYLTYEHFSPDFWLRFWRARQEACWESRVPGWRAAFEYVLMHYIAVQPELIDIQFADDWADDVGMQYSSIADMEDA